MGALDQQTDQWRQFAVRFSEQLAAGGRWARWSLLEQGVSWPSSLADAVDQWRHEDAFDSYLLVAALCRLGSRRGGDDADAALAVVMVLEKGVTGVAGHLRDVCGVNEVRAAVWEEVRGCEPQLGRRAPRFILQRAKQRLLRPGAGLTGPTAGMVSLDRMRELGLTDGDGWGEVDRDDSRRELRDLLRWAVSSGVLDQRQSSLVLELVEAGTQVSEERAADELSVRRGVSVRTIRRQRAAVLAALREAVPTYLAETA